MSDHGPLAVTGVTGRLGGRVARRLAEAGVPQRLVVRDPSRAPRLPGAEVAQADYRDHRAARDALHGVDTLLMVSAGEERDRIDVHRGFVDAAAEAGVRHVVYTSFFGAAPDCTFTLGRDHWATEEHLRGSGVTWTFLRDNLYLDVLRDFVGDDGVIRGPADDGRLAAVAIDDVADVAAKVLQRPADHARAVLDLTGPAAISLAEAAATISAITGRQVTYHPETVEEAFASRRRFGAPDWQVAAWVSTYTAIAAGDLARVTGDVERVAGHPPRSLEQVLSGG
jgi:NAD(P)H dehydrogenase (quinone)